MAWGVNLPAVCSHQSVNCSCIAHDIRDDAVHDSVQDPHGTGPQCTVPPSAPTLARPDCLLTPAPSCTAHNIRDDAELNAELKGKSRWGDPLAHLAKKKKGAADATEEPQAVTKGKKAKKSGELRGGRYSVACGCVSC